MRRFLFVLASLFVSLVFLVLVLRDVPLADVIVAIRQANGWLVLVSFGLVGVAIWARGLRWRVLLDYRISARDSFLLMGITFLLNLLPLRAGELVRSVLATRSGVPFMTAATSVVVERLLDVLTVIFMLVFVTVQLPAIPPETARAMLLFGGLAGVGSGVLLFFAIYPDVAYRILGLVLRLLPFLERIHPERILNHVLTGLQPITRRDTLIKVLLWNLISWSVSLLSMYVMHLALAIDQVSLFHSTLMSVGLTALSIAIPVSIAAVGPFEAAIVLNGQLMGMAEIKAISLGFLYHGVAVAGYVLWGVVGFIALGISMEDVLKQADHPPESADAASTVVSG